MKIKIFVNEIEAIANLAETETSRQIYKMLPTDGAANKSGDEIYFVIPLKLEPEKNATDVLEKGDIAYWPEGCCLCIFFGSTPNPAKTGLKSSPKVNVFGRLNGDLSEFNNVRNGDLIIVEKG